MRARSSNCNGLCSPRERLAGQANDPDGDGPAWKTEIRGLLRPADYATYETLKESDLELFKLNEYAAGISNVAPLSAADRESILKTKLAYKERFRQLLLDSGLQRSDLSPAEREYAYSVTSRALEDYQAQLPPGSAPVPDQRRTICAAQQLRDHRIQGRTREAAIDGRRPGTRR